MANEENAPQVATATATESGPVALPKTKLKEIPLRHIRESKVALRDVDKTNEQYIELVDSIRIRGVLNPILVRELGKEDGEMFYSLVDGLQRFTASADAGRESVPAQIIELSDAQVLEAQIIANLHRVEMKPVQYSKQLHKILAENPFLTLSELSKRLAKSPSWLMSMLSLTKIKNTDIAQLINDGKIPLANAYVLAKLPEEEQLNFIERAMTEAAAQFAPAVNARVKEIRDAKRQGRDPDAEQFVAVGFLQKIVDIKTELSTPNALLALIEAKKPKTPMDAAKLALSWVLHLDEMSIAESKRKYDEKKKNDKDSKQKRDSEKLAKKAAAARMTAQELMAKATEQGLDVDAAAAEIQKQKQEAAAAATATAPAGV